MTGLIAIVVPLLGFVAVTVGAKLLFIKLRASGYGDALDRWDRRFRRMQSSVLTTQVRLSDVKRKRLMPKDGEGHS